MSAQTVPDQMLLKTANNELEEFVKENGYILNRDATYLSFPESNWGVPINTLGIIPAFAVVSGGGGAATAFAVGAGTVVFGAAGGVSVAAAAAAAGVAAAGVSVGAAAAAAGVAAAGVSVGAAAAAVGVAAAGVAAAGVAAGGAAAAVGVGVGATAVGAATVGAGVGAVIDGGVDEGHFINYVHFVDHFRTELHYSLLDPHTNQTINGSCIFFFSVDNENGSVSYEIDNCTHDEIFPQNEKGSLRIGEDGPDFWDWTQKDVVATDTFEIN